MRDIDYSQVFIVSEIRTGKFLNNEAQCVTSRSSRPLQATNWQKLHNAFIVITKDYLGPQNKENGMGWICGTYVTEIDMVMVRKLKIKKTAWKPRRRWDKKFNSNTKEDVTVWTGFIWHRKWTSGGSLWTRYRKFRFHKTVNSLNNWGNLNFWRRTLPNGVRRRIVK